MRITQTMLSNNMLRNLSNSYGQLGKLMEQASSQKKVNRPSDDPVVAMLGMGYRTDVNQVTQFKRNIGEVKNWVDSTDAALDNATKSLQRIRELTVRASTDSMEEDERLAMAKEVEQLKEQLLNLADTQIGGKYIFNGTKTNVAPTEDTDPLNTDTMEVEVFPGIKLPLNTEGESLFGQYINGSKIEYGVTELTVDVNGVDVVIDPTDPNISDADQQLYDEAYLEQAGPINALIQKLSDPESLSGLDDKELDTYLEDLDAEIDKFLHARANVGAKQNRVELMEDRIGQQEVFSKRIMSENEDVNLAEVLTELITQESVHRASLGIGARIIQPTLMDFLR